MQAGSFFPGKHFSSLYAMAGDDCSLHFDLDKLTEKQQQDHLSNVELTAMLQVALACIGHSGDHLALYDRFKEPQWQTCLARYHQMFSRLVGDVIPFENFSYHPKFEFYASVATLVATRPDLTDVVNLYMSSGSNSVIHQSDPLLQINRNVNSKQHFAEHAPAAGIPVPPTMVLTKADLAGTPARAFFDEYDGKIVAKLLGLAGARNVMMVDNIEDCQQFVEEYPADMVVLLQQRLPLDFYTEMTVDLLITDEEIAIANTRKLLFADGLWVGNLIGSSVTLTSHQVDQLLAVGAYAREQGYTSQLGSNCGVDFFVGKDGSIIVTEINARWTGGLFPAQVLNQIDTKGQDAIAFFDLVVREKREAYLDFLEAHLTGEYEGAFSMIPLGIGCFDVPIDGKIFYYTWQAVLGDFEAFRVAKQAALGDAALPTADIISA